MTSHPLLYSTVRSLTRHQGPPYFISLLSCTPRLPEAKLTSEVLGPGDRPPNACHSASFFGTLRYRKVPTYPCPSTSTFAYFPIQPHPPRADFFSQRRLFPLPLAVAHTTPSPGCLRVIHLPDHHVSLTATAASLRVLQARRRGRLSPSMYPPFPPNQRTLDWTPISLPSPACLCPVLPIYMVPPDNLSESHSADLVVVAWPALLTCSALLSEHLGLDSSPSSFSICGRD